MSETKAAVTVKEAIQTAKSYVKEMFAEDGIERIGLEEISFDEASDCWRITVGFSRVWDRDRDFDATTFGVGGWQMKYQELLNLLRRTYKIVTISAREGRVLQIENRPV